MGSYEINESGKLTKINVNLKSPHNNKKNTNTTNLESDSAVATKQNMEKLKGQSLKLTENPLKLVSVQTKGKKQIRCAALSPDGEFIVYSTDSNIRMLKLEMVRNVT